jgi:hypothetical protein
MTANLQVIARDGVTNADIAAEIARSNDDPHHDVIAAKYIDETDQVAVYFDDGIEVRFPRLSVQGLEHATPGQIANMVVEHAVAIAWPDLDGLKHYIPHMVDGVFGTRRHMAELGRRGGSSKSPAKAAAVRANGKKGGRPKTRSLSKS